MVAGVDLDALAGSDFKARIAGVSGGRLAIGDVAIDHRFFQAHILGVDGAVAGIPRDVRRQNSGRRELGEETGAPRPVG